MYKRQKIIFLGFLVLVDMTIWVGFMALSSPIVEVLGNTLSFIVGTTLAILLLVFLTKGFLFFKEFFYKRENKNEKPNKNLEGYYFTNPKFNQLKL